jgi:hypothetical protein
MFPGISRRENRGSFRDLCLYIAIAGVWYGALALFMIYQARRGKPDAELPLNWIAFAVVTAITFIDWIRIIRPWREGTRLWLPIGAALVTQLAVGTLALWRAPRLPTIIWAALLPLNYVALGLYREGLRRAKAWRKSVGRGRARR